MPQLCFASPLTNCEDIFLLFNLSSAVQNICFIYSNSFIHPSRVYYELIISPAPGWLDSSVGRALYWHHRGHGSRSNLNFFQAFFSQLRCVLTVRISFFYLIFKLNYQLPVCWEFTRSRTVPVVTCGVDKQSFTLAFTVKANCEKLPPKVIFKGVRQLKIQVPPRDASFHTPKGMDGRRRYELSNF